MSTPVMKVRRTTEGNAARSAGRMRRLDALVAVMYADYQTGLTLAEVGQKHGGRDATSVYKLFENRGLPRREARCSPGMYARIASTRRATLDELVAKMHAEYTAGASLAEVGRRYKRNRACIRELFVLRNLAVREPAYPLPARHANGCIIAAAPLTEAEIEGIIQTAIKIYVPAAVKREWRQWPMARRIDFINRLRARLNSPDDRPTTPFSTNVEPFDYGTVNAHTICDEMNAGRPSREAKMKIRIGSQGVIYQGQLWFWCHKTGYERGPWTVENGRPILHRTIWAQANGRPVPAKHIVSHLDGNPNNFEPTNLGLLSMNENCRRNQAAALSKKSRELTALLLNRSQTHDHDHTNTLQHLKGI